MRRALVTLALLGGGAALALAQPATEAPAPAARATSPGFDHIGHDGKVSVSGADPIACGACHALRAGGRLAGRPDHGTCFGACHGAEPEKRRARKPYPIDVARRRVCESCHAPAALDEVAAGSARKLTVDYPPYRTDPDYSITFPHDRHQKPSAPVGGCTACHATPADPGAAAPRRAPVHSRCARCHTGGDAPAMTQCTTCHLAAFGPATSPHLVRGAFPVTARFSHTRHMPRVGNAGCADCHEGVVRAGGDELPAPRTESCAGCHDGKRAFSTVEPRCSTCHSRPAERTRRPAMARAHYAHAEHRARGVTTACTTCHGKRGDAEGLADPRHAPCSDAGCHAEQFVSTAPTICAVCHVGFEPWRALHADVPARGQSEFGVRFDHRGHLGGDTPRLTTACDGCHRPDPRSGSTRPPIEHAGCSGEGCHDQGAEPALAACASCHQPGARAARHKQRSSRSYSVRARFDHRPHRRAGAEAVGCDRCHTGVLESAAVRDIPAPTKATCAPCHDGAAAFKMTGHGCQRCHGKL